MVIDRGPGVPASSGSGCSSRSSGSMTPRRRASGLGLAVARGLTEAVGGTLAAEDTPGGGLTMVVASVAAGRRRDEVGRMTRVLVVDDEPALARALAINLRAHGYEVVTAADGAAALPPPPSAPRTSSSSTSGCRTWTAPR